MHGQHVVITVNLIKLCCAMKSKLVIVEFSSSLCLSGRSPGGIGSHRVFVSERVSQSFREIAVCIFSVIAEN